MPGVRRRGRPRTAWVDNIKLRTGLSVEESVRMTEDRDKWRKYVHGVAKPRIQDGYKEQNRTEQNRTNIATTGCECRRREPWVTAHGSSKATMLRACDPSICSDR